MPEISQEEYDEITKNLRIIKFQLQEAQDTLEGGIRSANIKEFRNTYVINAQDSLDDSYPLYVHFNIINEMVKVVSVKVDFWIMPFRAYSTAVPSGGGHTTASGGSSTSGSGGGQTSSDNSGSNYSVLAGITIADVTNVGDENASGKLLQGGALQSCSGGLHTHTVANHTHTTPNHTHEIADHSHDLSFGIYEEDNSPTIKFYVSENEGVTYSDVFGGYDADKSAIDITSLITTKGSKLIKFESDVRARLSVQVMVKLDIS